ncbi:hypothetical protein F1559_002108 [Cyanidiococcus yangmingshanensis]|uniref:Ribosomal RNA-processing protein 7 C-terminal domain-containing protein n=1 Tax=Cyanidiococcus yangmingshanensis TaxID=2690220 RepID=A0A7J7ID89_9RHOD|nr:hypothetical protein F1559_002108 [Cyanidiococcus yangmingshanensis]
MVSFHLKHALPTPLRGALQTNCFFDWFWLRFQYDHPVDLEVLEEECNQVMAAHERQLRRTAREAQRKRNFVDDEGFTLVMPRTRRRQHPNHAYTLANHGLARPQSEVTEATHTKPAALTSGKDRQTNGAHAGFYRFQREEEKRQKLAELQAKFERDKQRLRHLRAVRQPFLN